MARRLAGDRRQRLHEGVEVGDVGRLHAGIGRVGKGRIEMLAAGRNAAQHGVGEILDRPGADAVCRIGRNVRRHEGAERRLQFKPAGQFQPRLALRTSGVHGRTCSRRPRKSARRASRRRSPSAASVVGVEPLRRRQEPERRRADAAKDERGDGELSRTGPSAGSALLDAVGLVAAAAICADRAELRLQRLDILRRSGDGRSRDRP